MEDRLRALEEERIALSATFKTARWFMGAAGLTTAAVIAYLMVRVESVDDRVRQARDQALAQIKLHRGAAITAIDAKAREFELLASPVGSVRAYAGPLFQADVPVVDSAGRLAAEAKRKQLAEDGWMVCMGQPLKGAVHAKLFTQLRNRYGTGIDPQTKKNAGAGYNFNLPDYRGLFLRGADDGKAGRTPEYRDLDRDKRLPHPGTGEAGLAAVGSVQTSAFAKHKHPVTLKGGAHPSNQPGPRKSGLGNAFFPIDAPKTRVSGGRHTHTGDTDTSGESSETRPANVYVHWIIKVK